MVCCLYSDKVPVFAISNILNMGVFPLTTASAFLVRADVGDALDALVTSL